MTMTYDCLRQLHGWRQVALVDDRSKIDRWIILFPWRIESYVSDVGIENRQSSLVYKIFCPYRSARTARDFVADRQWSRVNQ